MVCTNQHNNMTTAAIANRLVTMCRNGQVEEAKEALFSPDITSTEPREGLLPKEVKGMEAVRAKALLFVEHVENFYGHFISDPLVAGDYFSISWDTDLQMKGGERNTSTELCVYKVKDGKIVSEQFFY